MIIGDATYYRLSSSPTPPMGPSLVRTSDFDSNIPCPDGAPFVNYLVIWRGMNGPAFFCSAGSLVRSSARRHHMTLGEFCEHYSDMDGPTIAAIKKEDLPE